MLWLSILSLIGEACNHGLWTVCILNYIHVGPGWDRVWCFHFRLTSGVTDREPILPFRCLDLDFERTPYVLNSQRTSNEYSFQNLNNIFEYSSILSIWGLNVSPTWLIWQHKILWILYKHRPAITLIASSNLNNTVQLVDIYNSSVACLWMSWIRVIPADGILLRTSEGEQPEDCSQPPKDLRLR